MNIPMVDLKKQYNSVRREIDKNLQSALDSCHFILGPFVNQLEIRIAEYIGVGHAIGLASGTDALHLALRAAGVSAGDEVITTPFTFIATAEAICYTGARPVFIEIDPGTYNMDPARIEAAITQRTKAVLPVHLFGQACDMETILSICRDNRLICIEDCAQSFGAEFNGRKTGSAGDAGCFSFFPSKNLGAYGDGGMIVTNDDKLAEEVRSLRNHGSKARYVHSQVGYNSRLDELQAAVLLVKLKHIDDYNSQRRINAHLYTNRLSGSNLVTPFEDPRCYHVYHQYTIRTKRRESIQESLTRAGIASAIHYPIPLHRQEVFGNTYDDVALTHSEEAANEVLSLPMYPELTEDQINFICDTIQESMGQ
jgi:dTDP-4-amino-4,6-dideoxygalactose transaminase